jgi:hypothetical protein
MKNLPCPFCGKQINNFNDHSAGCYFKAIESPYATEDDIAYAWDKRSLKMQVILIDSYNDPMLSEENIKHLKSQNVIIEDWDLMLFVPIENCSLQEEDVELFDEEHNYYYTKTISALRPSWKLQKIVSSYDDNAKWYENIDFLNKTWILGIKHH